MSNLAQIIKEVDGVEFYTDAATGASGVSQSGLAVLCGVTRDAISKLLKSLYSEKPYKGLEHLVDKLSECRTQTQSGMWLCNDELSVAIIRYYDRKGNKTAQYTFDKFATIGFNAWIQSITGWQPVEEKVEPTVILPTNEQLDFMRSRAWERAEMDDRRMSNAEIKERSGFSKRRLLGAKTSLPKHLDG